uniref:Transposase n=1 Tax=Panagrolaimus superbus TaxID=310955 RepID=A0A914YZQ4_9BILA
MWMKSAKQRLKEYKIIKRGTGPAGGESHETPQHDYIPDFDPYDDMEVDDDNYSNLYNNDVDMEDVELDSEGEESENIDEPLYENSPYSVTEFSVTLMAVFRDKHITDAASTEILNLFRVFLPASNKVPSTFVKLKTIITSLTEKSLITETCVFCSSCLKEICTCKALQKAVLLICNVMLQLESLFSRHKGTMEEFRIRQLAKNELSDIHQTVYYRSVVEKSPFVILLSIYTDGGRYTKSGSHEGWPLVAFALDLPLKLRHKYSNIIFFGYWYGKNKPDWNFVFKKLGRLSQFTYEGVTYRVKYLQAVADIPARQLWLSMVNVPGYNCCFNCNIHGEYKQRRVIYPYVETNPRDPNTFLNKTDGVNGISELYEMLESFPGGMAIDSMHTVYRGPVEVDFKTLLQGFRRDPNVRSLLKLSNNGKASLDILLTKMKFPKEYQRNKLRSINAMPSWKASELKLVCLYVVPTVLLHIASTESTNIAELIDSMIQYSAAIRILSEAKINAEMIEQSDKILNYWSKNRARLWTETAMTFKVHENLHLPQQTLMHGPLATYSAFAGESCIGEIGKDVSCYNIEVTVKQIAERLELRRASVLWLDKHGSSKVKSYFNYGNTNSKTKIPKITEEIDQFLKDNLNTWTLCGEITVAGFAIAPFFKSESVNCYICLNAENGWKAMKVVAIAQKSPEEIYFCGYFLKVKSYSNLMQKEGFLASQTFAYQYCCYGDKNDFQEDSLSICNVQRFLAKYVFIVVDDINFLMKMPHPYEHN